MKRDTLFFEFFRDLPQGFFKAIGRNDLDPQQYDLKSLEFKESAVRLDGVFEPRTAGAGPAYIWEAQWYPSDKVYANLLSKIGRFLEHRNPHQLWVAVLIYPTRSMEQKNLEPYRCLLNSDQMIRIYLDEFSPPDPHDIEMSILHMIASDPNEALREAQELVPRVRAKDLPAEKRDAVIQLISSVMVCQFPKMSRKEIERMIKVTDIRQTRVFQEALQEGREEGREEGSEKRALDIASQALRVGMSNSEVVKLTGLSTAKVRALKKQL